MSSTNVLTLTLIYFLIISWHLLVIQTAKTRKSLLFLSVFCLCHSSSRPSSVTMKGQLGACLSEEKEEMILQT